jgi:hypothetical protein
VAREGGSEAWLPHGRGRARLLAALLRIRGGSRFLTGKAEPGPGRKPFVATLEWLLRPKNFAKVVEGTYHQ